MLIFQAANECNRSELKVQDVRATLKRVLGFDINDDGMLEEVQKLMNVPILVIEGIIIFQEPFILNLCDSKFFIEIEKSVCWQRRKSRVWDPEGSCWEEDPNYFEAVAWPEYLRSLDLLQQLEVKDINYLESNNTSNESNFIKIVSRLAQSIQDKE